MLRTGSRIRFTAAEIEEGRQLGLDLAEVKTRTQYSDAVIDLICLLERDRPELLEQIAVALAAQTGRKLPAKLVRIK